MPYGKAGRGLRGWGYTCSDTLPRAAMCSLMLAYTVICSAHDKPVAKPQASLEQVRDLVNKQLCLIRTGKAEELRPLFTPRLRKFITAEVLKEGAKNLTNVTVEELVAEIRQLEKQGRPIVVVRRRDGRLLTVLVWRDGQWLADTLWFH